MTNPVLYLIFPRMLAVVHPARTTQFVNLVSQIKDIAAYVPRDLQAMTVELVNHLKPGYTVTTFHGLPHRTQNRVEKDKQKKWMTKWKTPRRQ